MTEQPVPPVTPEDPAPDVRHLPEPVRPEDLVTTVDTRPAPDPNGGRDPDHEFFLRHIG